MQSSKKRQRKKKSLQRYRALSDNCMENKVFVSKNDRSGPEFDRSSPRSGRTLSVDRPLFAALVCTKTINNRQLNRVSFTWLSILFWICWGWEIRMSHRVNSICCRYSRIIWIMCHVCCSICHGWSDAPYCCHNWYGRLLLTMALSGLWPHHSWCITENSQTWFCKCF